MHDDVPVTHIGKGYKISLKFSYRNNYIIENIFVIGMTLRNARNN